MSVFEKINNNKLENNCDLINNIIESKTKFDKYCVKEISILEADGSGIIDYCVSIKENEEDDE